MAEIGFIGLGIMGAPMCRNLLKAGHKVVVYNRSSGAIDRLVELGAARGESLRDVAERSNIVITMMLMDPRWKRLFLVLSESLKGRRLVRP
jgi:2-hydroxy-3-oxopropionate reductase